MQTIILHIGMPKTGTTTIQKALNSGAKELKECDAIFPKSGMFSEGAAAHHALFYSVASSRSAIRTPLPHPKESFEAMVEDIRNEMNISRSKFIILSSEMLWNPIAFDKTALCRIREAFPGYKIIILAYLRPVEEHSVSAYAQRVTGPQLYDRS